jgi:hypothetical protein
MFLIQPLAMISIAYKQTYGFPLQEQVLLVSFYYTQLSQVKLFYLDSNQYLLESTHLVFAYSNNIMR